MVTLMALFTLPLYSQPCLVSPPFWDPRDAASWETGEHTFSPLPVRGGLSVSDANSKFTPSAPRWATATFTGFQCLQVTLLSIYQR